MIAGLFKNPLIKWLCFFVSLGEPLLLFSEHIEVYDEIEDLCHPTIADLQKIQDYLLHAERPDLKNLVDKEFIPRTFKFIGKTEKEQPAYYWSAVNSNQEERENCIVIYSSFNERYPRGALRLYRMICSSSFKGHVHCRIGGWPDIENGSLVLAHVPFAFKVCFIKEMQRKGYKRVLWMDASLLPYLDLNRVFEMVKQRGYLIQKNSHRFHFPYMNVETAEALGYSFDEASSLLSCAAHFLAVDLTFENVVDLIDDWYKAAHDPAAFYSARSDQTALSLLLHKKGMTDWLEYTATGSPGRPFPDSLFLIDREYVKDIK